MTIGACFHQQPHPCHSERSEESSWISAPLNRIAAPAGFFAPLRMTNCFENVPGITPGAQGVVPTLMSKVLIVLLALLPLAALADPQSDVRNAVIALGNTSYAWETTVRQKFTA